MKRHKKHLVLSLCLVAGTAVYGQDTLAVGTKIDGTNLNALCYTFPQRIETFSMSNKRDYLCISFRETTKSGKYLKNKGEIGFYDTNNKKLLWKQPIDYSQSKASCLAEGVLISHLNNKVSLLNREDGTKRWQADLYPIHIDDSLGLLLGYHSSFSSKLKAIGLNSGNELWQNKLEHKYGWNQVLDLNENKRLIVADELHRLDFVTGKLNSIPGDPGAHDTKAAILQGLVAVAAGAAGAVASGGAFYYSYVPISPNMITSLTSNVLPYDSHYYWADRKQISCIDSTMNIIWQKKFPDVKAASSRLFIADNKLYMLSYGYGLREGGSRKKYGRPFIACYDIQDGKELSFNPLSMKKDIVEDVIRTNDALYLLFDDGLAYQTLTDSVVNVVPWDTKQYGKLQGMLPGTLYVANESRTAFNPLAFDGEYCLVYNDQGTVYEIDKELNINKTYNPADIYIPYFHLKDYLCVGRAGDYHFIHKLGMPVAHLKKSFKKGRVMDNKLLLLSYDNQLLFLDLDEAVN